jgi:hypothetical protein
MTTKERIPYLDRLGDELVRSIRVRRSTESSAWFRRPSAVPAALATGAIAAIVLAIVLAIDPSGELDGRIDGDIGPGTARCVEGFSVENLAGRGFAFDGTIIDVATVGDPGADVGAGLTEVTFRVHHWYKGGSADEAVLKTYEQPGVITSVDGGLELTPGTRLLVSGDADYLWPCGFTVPYTEASADLFARAFQA